jgi:hypothetical protein
VKPHQRQASPTKNGADGNILPMTRRGILSCATTANTFPA